MNWSVDDILTATGGSFIGGDPQQRFGGFPSTRAPSPPAMRLSPSGRGALMGTPSIQEVVGRGVRGRLIVHYRRISDLASRAPPARAGCRGGPWPTRPAPSETWGPTTAGFARRGDCITGFQGKNQHAPHMTRLQSVPAVLTVWTVARNLYQSASAFRSHLLSSNRGTSGRYWSWAPKPGQIARLERNLHSGHRGYSQHRPGALGDSALWRECCARKALCWPGSRRRPGGAERGRPRLRPLAFGSPAPKPS